MAFLHELDRVEVEINKTIDRLISSLNERRIRLVTELREKREEVRSMEKARERMEQQLNAARLMLEQQMTHNRLHSMQDKVTRELQAGLDELRIDVPNEIKFFCDTRDINERISSLGEIGRDNIPHIPSIPNYATFQYPIVAVGKAGSGPGEFNSPRGVSVQENTGHIFIADSKNKRIQIFSEIGEHLTHFGCQHLISPWGILAHQNTVFISDTEVNALFKFTTPDLTLRTVVGRKGTGNGEFRNPRQLVISPNELIYVADQGNDRVQILDYNLALRGCLQHQSMTSPVDVKFSVNQIFVLSYWDNPCIHIFALTGEKLRSIIPRGVQINSPFFFCLDASKNIIVSDRLSNRVKVFSPKGDLLHVIGGEGNRAGLFYNNGGIALLNGTQLVCVSNNTNYALQIFPAKD